MSITAASPESPFRDAFLEASSYQRSDLLAWNPTTGRFYTRNGGLYEMDAKGNITDIKGPPSDPEERIDDD